ncbi:hypothetical protein KY285_032817 [Solanum tuberosum]|nr:hypothetical protein KY289_032924 [Solanum tuberosum]KAH0647569.1 hypothetical protein KY285_032817 [Solanum tuberosum]
MDLNFYGYFIDKFKIMNKETTTVGGRTLKQLLAEFVWQDDAVDYVRGKRPYPGGMDWIGAKRILALETKAEESQAYSITEKRLGNNRAAELLEPDNLVPYWEKLKSENHIKKSRRSKTKDS